MQMVKWPALTLTLTCVDLCNEACNIHGICAADCSTRVLS
jgi:hypothetical protein